MTSTRRRRRHLHELAPGVFAYVQEDGSWFINTTGFVTGTRTTVAIDSCATEARTRELISTIRSTADQPITTLVNTHHHADHTNGNHLFGDAVVVAHQRCRTEMRAIDHRRTRRTFGDVAWGDITPAPPSVTFADRMTVWSDEREIRLHAIGPAAHTTNDVVVWLPAERVLFAGDLVMNGVTPFVLQGSVSGSLAAVDLLRAFDADVIVPGHGPVGDPSMLDDTAAYLSWLQSVAEDGWRAGLTPLEAARETELGAFAELADPERLVGNLHRAYKELAGAPPGGPLDLAAAMADMVAFNGGRPLTCKA